MAQSLCMLAVMLLIVMLSSFVASLIPGRPVPEVVFFVFVGAIAGPRCLGLVRPDAGLALLGRMGLGLLFLMAGYELDPRELTGRMGREATLTWAASMILALLVVPTLGLSLGETGNIAFAIALTTTAYGTLVPIMSDRGLNGTPVGKVIESYGAMGEIWPVLAMSVLLSPDRSHATSVAVLLAFVLVCVAVARGGEHARELGGRLSSFLRDNAEGASRPMLRATMLLLVALLALAELLGLDAVLGAFAAGFVLGHVMPRNHPLEGQIQTLGNGFLVPAFFVYSGIGIDFGAVLANPTLLLTYVGLLLLVRTVPMLAALSHFSDTRDLPAGERASAALYCTMALPLIVAITEVATASGAMEESMASVLVTAGALTVLVIPVITSFTRSVIAAHPVEAVREISHHPDELRQIIHEHELERRHAAEAFYEERRRLRAEGRRLSSADWLAEAHDVRHDVRRRMHDSARHMERIAHPDARDTGDPRDNDERH